ncbi:MAG: hypothetical protein ACRDG8_09535 [Actinomycetota bacterium]
MELADHGFRRPRRLAGDAVLRQDLILADEEVLSTERGELAKY